MFQIGRRRLERRRTIERLYGAIVAQAREPVFYRAFAVPDTIEGRFDLMVLHVHLACRRLGRDEDEAMRSLSQDLFDEFCADMDASLREYGVGDLSVPKRMREIGEAFFGRAAAYDAALAAADNSTLAAALLRNIYSGNVADSDHARRLALYVRAASDSLDRRTNEEMAAGNIGFPAAAEVQA